MPTVVRRSPKPIRTAIGDLSDSRRLLARFDLEQQNYIKEESPMRKKLAKTDTTAAFERAVKAASPKEKYILRLYDVPGIGTKKSPWWRIHASASWATVQFFASATA